VFSHVIRGRPGGLFQFSGGGAVRIVLLLAACNGPQCYLDCCSRLWVNCVCKCYIADDGCRRKWVVRLNIGRLTLRSQAHWWVVRTTCQRLDR